MKERIDEGRRLIERFAADKHALRAAFWMRADDEGELWHLYLVTELVESVGLTEAFRVVRACKRTLALANPLELRVKVLRPSDPIAIDVLSILNRHPERVGTRFGIPALGSVAVDEAYIYPPRFYTFASETPMTRDDIGREIFRLMNRDPEILASSHVTLKDGTFFDGVPFSLALGGQKAVVAQFVADGEAAPRVVRLDEIDSIA